MACNRKIHNLVNGAGIQLPTVSRAAAEEGGRYGVRAILNPNEEARALLNEHTRLLSQLAKAKPDG